MLMDSSSLQSAVVIVTFHQQARVLVQNDVSANYCTPSRQDGFKGIPAALYELHIIQLVPFEMALRLIASLFTLHKLDMLVKSQWQG